MESAEPFNERTVEIERLVFSKEEKINFQPFEHQLWILLKGSLNLTFNKKEGFFIDSGQIFLLPKGSVCTFVITEKTDLFRFRLQDCVALCERFFSAGLFEKKLQWKTSFNPLFLTPLLFEYTRHLKVLFDECMMSDYFKRLLIEQLFYLLNFCYSSDSIAGLFYPLISNQDNFTSFILANYHKVKKVKELAGMAGQSIRCFERNFQNTFGVPPGEWLTEKKVERVYLRIVSSDIPLTLVADQCGFCSLSHLTIFCKRHFGMTPTELRKGKNY